MIENYEQEVVANVRNTVDLSATRWIVFAGDRTPPEFKRRFAGMELGGEYLGHEYKTLFQTKGLLRRCQLTPMVKTIDLVNPLDIGIGHGEGAVVAAGVRTVERRALSHDDPDNPDARRRFVDYGFDVLPGTEISGLFQVCQGKNDYGIREVEILRGVEPPRRLADGSLTESLATQIQVEIFPEWEKYTAGLKPFFKTTTELDNYLRDRKLYVSDEAAVVIEVILNSNSQFERWATTQLGEMARFVKAPPTAEGKVYTWEHIHDQWFGDLGLQKEAFLTKADNGGDSRSNAPSREEFLEMQRRTEAAQARTEQLLEQLTAASLRIATASIGEINPPAAIKESVESEKRTCKGTKADQTPCSAYAKADSDFCAMHQNQG